MREVEVQRLIEWECRGIVVQCDVVLRSGSGNDMILETGENLLHISNPHRLSCRGLEIVVSGKVKIDGIFKTLPFFVGEKVTKSGISKCYSLIWTECLRATAQLSAFLRSFGWDPRSNILVSI